MSVGHIETPLKAPTVLLWWSNKDEEDLWKFVTGFDTFSSVTLDFSEKSSTLCLIKASHCLVLLLIFVEDSEGTLVVVML